MTYLKDRLRQSATLTALAMVMALPAVSPSVAQSVASAEQPVQTTATYSDWTVRCRQVTETDTQQCEMVQVLSTPDRQNTVANLAIGKLPGDDAVRFVVQLPLGVHLPTDVAFTIGERDVATAQFETCYENFCLAYATLDEFAIAEMRAGMEMTMSLKDRAQRDLVMQLSLSGFTAAFEATFAEGS